ncbi:4-hydroxy-tetrahydrodipicolinate reductase [Candidatus Microgenomates bacterium]|nr:4-hydroxy-tetrahydrodipicolinate reductase [Candidatus Microgenomates bacterium]
MKIALIGFGNMGKEVERLTRDDGKHQVVSISLKQTNGQWDEVGIKSADVVIDFTHPQVVLENIKKVASLGKNMVVGTTGWYDQIDQVKKIVKAKKIGLIYAQNFSVGANIFFKIIAFASKLFAKFGGYDVYGFEVHHTGKKDSPSGTALRLAKEILGTFPAKERLQTEKLNRQIEKDELHFASIRGGRNPGFHQVVFDSPADSITLSHQAHGRGGFAQGAILAAEFIKDKKGFYNFDEVFTKGGE